MSEQCTEHRVSLSRASLIDQPWLRRRDHLPATICKCGHVYHSWRKNEWYKANTTPPPAANEEEQ